MADASLADSLSTIKASSLKFYVYVMKHPDGTPFYVGKGHCRRIAVHEEHAKTKKRSRKLSIIRGIWNDGHSVEYEIIGFYSLEPDALSAEEKLIAKFGRRDLSNGCLANATNGGEGVSGHIHTDDARIKMRKGILTGTFPPEARSLAMKKLIADPEFQNRKKASEVLRVAKISAHQKSEGNRIAKSAQMKQILSTNHDLRDKRVAHLRSVAPDKATAASITTASWSDKDIRARRINALREATNKPELIEKRRAQMLLKWSDPDARRRQSEASKAAHLRKKKEKESRGVGT